MFRRVCDSLSRTHFGEEYTPVFNEVIYKEDTTIDKDLGTFFRECDRGDVPEQKNPSPSDRSEGDGQEVRHGRNRTGSCLRTSGSQGRLEGPLPISSVPKICSRAPFLLGREQTCLPTLGHDYTLDSDRWWRRPNWCLYSKEEGRKRSHPNGSKVQNECLFIVHKPLQMYVKYIVISRIISKK